MVCACIDIGSNTTRVLVAERDGRAPHARCCSSAPSRARHGHGRAADRARRRSRRSRASSPSRSRSRARAGAQARPRRRDGGDPRRAVNRDEFAAHGDAGATSRSSTGRRRRGWRSSGATAHARRRSRRARVAVVDVGGGSTEIAIGTVAGGRRRGAASLPGRLRRPGRRATCTPTRRRSPSSGPPRDARDGRARHARRSRPPTAPWPSAAAPPRCARLVGDGARARRSLKRALGMLCGGGRAATSRPALARRRARAAAARRAS